MLLEGICSCYLSDALGAALIRTKFILEFFQELINLGQRQSRYFSILLSAVYPIFRSLLREQFGEK